MTIKTYRRIGNLSLGLAGAAALCFDAFRNPLIPGSVLVGAGVLAGAIHAFARFRPLDPDCPEGTAEQSRGITREDAKPSIAPDVVARRDSERTPATAISDLLDSYLLDVDAMATEKNQAHRLATRHFYYWTFLKSSQASHDYLGQHIQQEAPDWRAVLTAVEVAKALNPQPTEYEVTLTPDGALKISPKLRGTHHDPQFEERRPVNRTLNRGESELVH